MNYRTKNTMMLVLIALLLPSLWVMAADPLEPSGVSGFPKYDITDQPVDDLVIHQMPGFPIVLEPDLSEPDFTDPQQQWSLGGAVLADLDGIGDLEIVHSYQTGSRAAMDIGAQGKLWAWDSSGMTMPGFPVLLSGGAYQAPSVGDLDGDGDQEIVQLTEKKDSADDASATIRLYVLDHLGNVLPGFPKIAGQATLLQGAALYDLDDDDSMEIVVSSESGIRIFESDGDEWDFEFQDSPSRGVGIPAIGDVDHDGEAEIFVPGFDSLHLLNTDGSQLDGWPLSPEGLFFGWMSMAALADLDGDLDLEIIIAGVTNSPRVIEVHVFHHDGTEMEGWPVVLDQDASILALFGASCSPLVTDLERDGEFEILIGAGAHGEPTMIYAWDSSGIPKPGFPFRSEETIGDSYVFMLTAADYNGDGLMEVFADSSLGTWNNDPEERSYLFGINSLGQSLPGFPLRPVGFSGQNGAVFEDVDKDGDYEIASISRDVNTEVMYVNLYDLNDTYLRSDVDWPTYHASNHRGGLQKRQYRGWRYVRAGGRIGN